MITELKEKRMIESDVTIGKEIVCDCCGKQIYHYIEGEEKDPVNYYLLITGHEDWGNDSVDSIEKFELCSDSCLITKINQFLEDEKHRKTKYFRMDSCTEYGF